MKYNYAYLTVTKSDGSRKTLKFYGKTQKEANKKRDRAEAQYEAGILTINSNTLFSKWLEEWLEIYKKPKITPGTLADIKGLVQRVYSPTLGHMKLEDIRLIHIQKCINETVGTSKSNISKCRCYIKDIFAKAYDNELIQRNPTAGLVVPQSAEEEPRRPMTDKEIDLFKGTMLKHHRGDFFGIMLACGLRPGEARALTIFSVDKKKHNVTVSEAVENYKNTVKAPKTKSGKRTIPIPDWYWPILEEATRKAEQSDSCYLFPNSQGKPMNKQRYLDSWHSFLRDMDISAGAKLYRNKVIVHAVDQELVPYNLRHTYATGLAEKGVDLKTAQYLLGHKDIRITANIYTHVTEKMIEEARQKIM